MTAQNKLIKRKLSLIELAKFLKKFPKPEGLTDVQNNISMTSEKPTKSMGSKAWKEKAAKEDIVYTEKQLQALELIEKKKNPDEIETENPSYLLAQDTFYVGYLKGVAKI